MGKPDLAALQQGLGYQFKDAAMLRRALTHSSRKNELPYSNERMEFLGDAVLGMIISEHLYTLLPDQDEGELTRIKSYVVSRATLAHVGRELCLAEHLLVGKGISSKKRLPASVVANAFEAVVTAIYFDGGLAKARRFVIDKLRPQIDQAREEPNGQNAKSLLQQYTQRAMGAAPTYKVLREEGPDHVKSFQVIAVINGKEYGSGKGRTKKEAEQKAAAETLSMLLGEPEEK